MLVTVYNTAAFLPAALESVLVQTHDNLELIVVDDCSTDGSWDVAADWLRRDQRVRALRRMSRGGASGGLNDGLALATGAFITRQDSDDAAMPSRLSAQLDFLERHPEVGAVGTQAIVIDPAGIQIGRTSHPTSDAEIQATLLDRMCFVGPSIMARRDVFERSGRFFDAELSGSEDYDLALRLAEHGALANLAEPLYYYRQHASSVSQSLKAVQMWRKARALENAMQRRWGARPPEDMVANVARDFLKTAVLAHQSGEPIDKTECVRRAAALRPVDLSSRGQLPEIIRKLTPAASADEAARFVCSLFDDVLPRNPELLRLKRRLVAELHMASLFRPVPGASVGTLRRHLWAGVRHDPSWLANRGVWSVAVRALTGRLKAGP